MHYFFDFVFKGVTWRVVLLFRKGKNGRYSVLIFPLSCKTRFQRSAVFLPSQQMHRDVLAFFVCC